MNGTLNTGQRGFCCDEMEILESNSRASAFTPHPCSPGASNCDKKGCRCNSYALGYRDYYGPGLELDMSNQFTAVTRFETDDGTTTGKLARITRLYV